MKKQAIVAVLIAAMMVVPATAQKRKTAVRKKAAPVVELTKEEQRFEELLDATQQIMFIDSIVVDKQEFLNFYKLTSEAGTVTNYNPSICLLLKTIEYRSDSVLNFLEKQININKKYCV